MEIIRNIESRIVNIRGQHVLLDSVIAELYGVETKYVNRAVKNNPDKFPDGYVIDLNAGEKAEVVQILHHLGSVQNLKFSHATPKAFTEKGFYMLATILKSPQATATTIAIIEMFSKIRELGRGIKQLQAIQDENAKKPIADRAGEIITEILDDGLVATESETVLELNLAVVKLKRTVKRRRGGKEKS